MLANNDDENHPFHGGAEAAIGAANIVGQALEIGEMDENTLDKLTVDVEDFYLAKTILFEERTLPPLSVGGSLLNNLKMLNNTKYPRGIKLNWPNSCDPFLESIEEQRDSSVCLFCGISFHPSVLKGKKREKHILKHLGVENSDLHVWSLVKVRDATYALFR